MSNIPPDAKCVFKGVIFEVWQWQQEMFDGSVETFEHLKRADNTTIFATVDNKIMIQDQEQPAKAPFISCPGGRVEEGEDPLSGAKRELLEETGYVSDGWKLWYASNPVGKMDWTVHIYIARNCQKRTEPKLDAGEKIKNRFISFDGFLDLADNPDFHGGETIQKLLRAKYVPKEREKLYELLFGK